MSRGVVLRTVGARPVLAAALLASSAAAQEAIHTDSTAVPSDGHVAFKQEVRYLRLGEDPTPAGREVEEWRSITTVEYGIRSDLALAAYVPVAYRETDSDDGAGADFGLDDITLSAKWRVYRNDFGPIDTVRFSIVAGAELPTGADAFSTDSVDPVLGGVFSYIEGRHGLNADLRYQFTTGGNDDPVLPGESAADALFGNAAYLFRVEPATFGAHSNGALYAAIEGNGVYETNGDWEFMIAPGLLYEAPHFAIEASIQLPLWDDLEHRPVTEFTLTIGARFLF